MKINENKPPTERWSEYLSEGEKIISEYDMGRSIILVTNQRVISLKKFPKSFVEVKYEDIRSLEHLTQIAWSRFINALVFLAIGYYIYNLSKHKDLSITLGDIFKNYFPELYGIFPFKELIILGIATLFILSIYHFLTFLMSIQGYLIISRKDRAPIKIGTAFTQNVRDLIRAIEKRITEREIEVRPALEVLKQKQEIHEEVRISGDELEKISLRIEEEIKTLGETPILLISTKSENHIQAIIATLSFIINKKNSNGIYISVNRPYMDILRILTENNINLENIVFIDCVSHSTGRIPKKAENAVFIENPSSLEEIGMYTDKLLVRLKPPTFILLDSLSSLLIYNTQKSVKEFVHFIINRMRVENIGGIILAEQKKEADDIVRTLIPMCDREITI